MARFDEVVRHAGPPHNASRDGDIGKYEKLLYGALGTGLVGAGVARKSLLGLGLIAVGGGVIYRALTGAWPRRKAAVLDADYALRVERAITIQRPVEDVYGYYRQFENLPTFMDELESVTTTGPGTYHWVVKGPAGRHVEWDAEIINELPNELIAWRTVGDPDVASAGSVRFIPAPGGRGTEVHAKLEYLPPLGVAGAQVAKILGADPDAQVREGLRGLKAILEGGSRPTTTGQPRGSTPKFLEGMVS